MLEACSRERKAGGVHSSKLISFPRPTSSVRIHSLFIFLRCVLALRSHICRRRPRHEFIESPPRQHERPHGAVGQQPQSHKTLAITTGGRFRNCPHFYLCSIPLPPCVGRRCPPCTAIRLHACDAFSSICEAFFGSECTRVPSAWANGNKKRCSRNRSKASENIPNTGSKAATHPPSSKKSDPPPSNTTEKLLCRRQPPPPSLTPHAARSLHRSAAPPPPAPAPRKRYRCRCAASRKQAIFQKAQL